MIGERATTMATGSSAPAPENDHALVVRARRGDAEAFRALYDRHAPGLLALLSSLLKDRGRAEEALADTFVKAHAGLASFDPERAPPAAPESGERAFASWLAGIARHVAIDVLRASSKEPKSLDAPDAASRAPGPEAIASAREGETLALELLATLPERARQVVLLRYRKGLTQSETAAALGCSRRLVANIQKEALEALARLSRRPREEVL